MDPISAMAFAIIVSGAIVHGAWDAGVDQARAEARHAADAIRKDLRRRRKAWAKQLEERLAGGRKGGPATALWWGWAAMRTVKAARRALRREPRAAERAIGGPVGPFRRVFGAAWRGAQYARDEARRQRAADERVTRTPVAVCGRCGAVTARNALVMTPMRFGGQAWMCATCRAAVDAERQQDQKKTQTSEPEPDITDADIIHGPDAGIGPPKTEPEPEDIPPSSTTSGTSTPPPPEPPAPKTTVTVERIPDPAPEPAAPVESAERPALNTTPGGEGMPRQLAPARGGALATRNAAMTRRGGGDSYTHGQWNRATADVHRRLEMLPALLEQMLGSLNHADAGRTQVAGVMAFNEDAVLLMGQIRDMLRAVNAKEIPMVEAVTTAGGPNEIPNLGYFREI